MCPVIQREIGVSKYRRFLLYIFLWSVLLPSRMTGVERQQFPPRSCDPRLTRTRSLVGFLPHRNNEPEKPKKNIEMREI
jgi:hypothetical protein